MGTYRGNVIEGRGKKRMKRKRNLKERICALVLALVLPLTGILPNLGMVVYAEDVDAYFFVYEEEYGIENPVNKIPVKGAELIIDGQTYTTDEDGKCEVLSVAEGTEIVVKRIGYKELTTNPTVQAGTTENNPQEICLTMDEISLSNDNVILQTGTTGSISFLDGTKIENANDLSYSWSVVSGSEDYAEIDPATGVFTAKQRGKAIIEVARNGKTAQKEITIKDKFDMTITATPVVREVDNTTIVTVTVNGIPADAGDVSVSATGTTNLGTQTVNASSNSVTFTIPEEKQDITFSAFYAEDENYLETSASTDVFTYKKNQQISIADSFETAYTYGDEPIDLISGIEGAGDREISFYLDEESKKILSVNAENQLEIIGAGTAQVTINAAESDNYTAASSTCEITVDKKNLGAIKVEDVIWSPGSKVYDGTKEISLTGTLPESSGVVSGDTITINAKAETAKADADEYSTFDYVSAEIPDNDNYTFTLDDTDNTGLTLADGGKITITQRNLYVQVKEGTSVSMEYGSSNEAIENELKNSVEIQLAGEDQTGAADSDKDSGLVGTETVDISSGVEAVLQDKDSTIYYVGTYSNAVQPNIIEEDFGNYKLVIDDLNTASGELIITQKKVEDIISMIQFKDPQDGVYKDDGKLWVINNKTLEAGVSSTASEYTDVYMKRGEDEYYQENEILLQTDEEANISVDDIAVYLSNKNDITGKTRTTSESGNTSDNIIPSGTIYIDNKLPEVQFSTELGLFGNVDMLTGSLVYRKFTGMDYDEKINLADDGSGLLKDESGNEIYEYKIVKIEVGTDTANQAIKDAALEETGWTQDSSKTISVPANNGEGFYVVLVKVEDNVGNKAVYSSNGIVIDITEPSIVIEGINSEVKYNKDINYQIKAEDTLSKIDKIVVKVTDKDGNEIEGFVEESESSVVGVNSFILENLVADNLAKENLSVDDLTKENLAAIENQYTVNGKILKDAANVNGITIKATAYDKAGNPSAEAEQKINVDITPPEAVYSYDNTDCVDVDGNYYFDSNRIMTVEYTERNFDPSRATFEINVDGTKYTTNLASWDSELEKVGVSLISSEPSDNQKGSDVYTDERVLSYQIEFGADEQEHEYKIEKMTIQDSAGNNGMVSAKVGVTAPTEFTIDRKAPEIKISYDLKDTDAKNDTFFQTERTMTVTYVERYFDTENVTLSLGTDMEYTLEQWLAASVDGVNVEEDENSSAENEHIYNVTFGGEGLDIDFNVNTSMVDFVEHKNNEIVYENKDAIEKTRTAFTVDMVEPELSVTYQLIDETNNVIENSNLAITPGERVYKNQTIQAIVTIEERNFAADDTFKDSISVAETAKDVTNVTDVANVKDQEPEAKALDKWKTEGNKHTQVFVFKEEANYTFNLTYKDLAGNEVKLIPESDEGHYFTVDKTAPEAQIIEADTQGLLDRIFAFFTNEEGKISYSVTMSDSTSPISGGYNKYYSEQDEDGVIAVTEELENLKWTPFKFDEEEWITSTSDSPTECTFEVEENEQIVPYVKVTDKAGNTTYLNANGAVYETQASDIQITGVEEGALYNDNVTFKITVNDEPQNESEEKVFSGLKEVHYEVWCDGDVPKKDDISGINVTVNAEGTASEGSEAVKDASFESKLRKAVYEREVEIPAELYNSNDVKIRVTATDNSGNTFEKVVPIKIDITPPELTVSYSSEQGAGPYNYNYFQNDRTMTISYKERNISEGLLTFDFTAKNTKTNISKTGITLAELRAIAEDVDVGIEISEVDDSQKYRKETEWKDDRVYEYTIKFSGEDMDYTITPYIEDQAGWKSYTETEEGKELIAERNTYPSTNVEANHSFTIDKVAPVMNVKYYLVDENGVQGAEFEDESMTDEIKRPYKNQTVRAVVTIDERNFGYDDAFADKQVNPSFTWKEHNGKQGNTDDYVNASTTRSEWTTSALSPTERTQSFDFAADGDYSFTLEYTDLAGNKLEEYDTHYVTVDKTAPTVNVVYAIDGKEISAADVEKIQEAWKSGEDWLYKNQVITATVSIDERNFARQDSAENFEENQMQLTYTAKNLEGNAVKTENYKSDANTRGKWATVENESYVRTQVFTFEEDANYEMSLVYKDLAGNECSLGSQKFTVDKTAPTGKISIPDSGEWDSGEAEENVSIWTKLLDIVYDFFVKESQTTTMESSDETSGVAGTYYYIDATATGKKTTSYLTADELGKKDWKPYTDGITVTANSQSAIYGKIVDKSGNITYLNAARGIIVDKEAPTVKLTDMTSTRNGIHYGDAVVGVAVTDPNPNGVYSGIEKVEYTIQSTTNKIASESGTVTMTYNEAEDERSQAGTGQIRVNAQKFNSNDVTVTVTAYDNTGNSYKEEIKLKIDVTAPVVENISWNTSAASNGKYYNVTRIATITVRERNFDPNQVRLNITNTDGTMPQISGWSVDTSGTSDNNISTCTVTFTSDGDYNMNMSCTDKAGNASNTVTAEEFTIDKTVPVINVTFDNNNAANGKYYNASRTATITVNEHNFNGSEVQTAITSNSVTPGVNGWSGNGDVHSATVPFTTDGNYSFTVNYTDLAGNAAEVYNVNEFVIDLTKPEIEIFDIVDKSANNGEVAPGVRYSDTNYDVNGVSITYSGAKHSAKAVDGARSSIPNGESIKMADFAHTAETDDVYTMTAKVTDLAGNYDEKEVTFSVNRFGSNFIFSDATEAFLTNYYNNEEETLVVEEINVDTLTHRGINNGHDGEVKELKEGTDYTVKESGSEVSWKSYVYTINKENFEKEGLYNITIDSVDRATNEVNNKIKEANIEFVIDKTAPTVVITGIEDEGQYRTNERDITISAADNVAMDHVEVYVDDDERPVELFEADMIQNQKGELPYTLTSSSDWQKIKAVAVDRAGNVTDTSRLENSESEKWISVLVTSNMFVQFYRNTPLVIGTIVVILALAGIFFLILAKRRKKDEEEEAVN